MSKQYILYEHAAGYVLFSAEPEEFLTNINDIVSDVNEFKQVCQVLAFQPFKRGREALENLISISEGLLHPLLEEFLISNLPKEKYVLGVEDENLINTIKEKLEISCNSSVAVKELIRGIRNHCHNLVPGFCDINAATKVQLGLAHAFSRFKVKFDVNKVDHMIIHSITLVDQLDKDINSLTMRIREWYSHHFPELVKIVPETTLYIHCINAIRHRSKMPENAVEQLNKILNDPEKVQNVMEKARSSIGMDISNSDLENMYIFIERVMALTRHRKKSVDYLKSKMVCMAPNLAALIGEFVGARLIAQAGSLTNLAKSPASTVQILGAEKALFRALKTRGNTPKYGILFHSKFIGKATKGNKGRISRYLANKCSVASRIDCFRAIPTDVFGNKMKEQVEERLRFYESGQTPKKNTDIMNLALEEAEVSRREILKMEAKKAKKRKLEELYLSTELDQTMAALAKDTVSDVDTSVVKKKKKKLNESCELNDQTTEAVEGSIANEADTSVRKKEKRTLIDNYELNDQSMASLTEGIVADEVDTSVVKKKLNESYELNDQTIEAAECCVANEADTSVVKKKKSNDSYGLNNQTTVEGAEDNVVEVAYTSVVKKKKSNDNYELNYQTTRETGGTVVYGADKSLKKKKKKKKKKK